MTDKSNPLDRVGNAHEEEYFRRENAKLIEALRQKAALDTEADEIEAQTGVHDDAIAHHLAELGVTAETVGMLHLVPLVEVAWADGTIQLDERELLLKAADSAGISGGAPRAAFEALLETRPTEEYFETALDFVRAMLLAMDDEHRKQASGNLEHLAHRIADAAGGVFGLWGRVDENEREVLNHIAERLSGTRPDATTKLLGKL